MAILVPAFQRSTPPIQIVLFEEGAEVMAFDAGQGGGLGDVAVGSVHEPLKVVALELINGGSLGFLEQRDTLGTGRSARPWSVRGMWHRAGSQASQDALHLDICHGDAWTFGKMRQSLDHEAELAYVAGKWVTSRLLCAPVKAPRSCPNRMLSASDSGMTVQSRTANGPAALCVHGAGNLLLAATRGPLQDDRQIVARQPGQQ